MIKGKTVKLVTVICALAMESIEGSKEDMKKMTKSAFIMELRKGKEKKQ